MRELLLAYVMVCAWLAVRAWYRDDRQESLGLILLASLGNLALFLVPR